MQHDQFMGLPTVALEFLKENEVDPGKCPCRGRPFPGKLEIIGHYSGMLDDQFNLYRYELKNGKHADEYHQTSPWSSGPVHFIGLKVSSFLDVTTYEWTDEEIEKITTRNKNESNNFTNHCRYR